MRHAALVVVVTLLAVCGSSALVSTSFWDCSATITPTVTYDPTSKSYKPRFPNATDRVLYPAGDYSITPPHTGSVIIAEGASVTLLNPMVASECIQVFGTLSLLGAGSDGSYLRDPSIPHGTDCATVNQGFSSRVCGPARLHVTGTVHLKGFYTSLWLSGLVASTGRIVFDDNTFWWGNITNQGTIVSTGSLYFHGALINEPSGTVTLGSLRVDIWDFEGAAMKGSLEIVNYGSMFFNRHTSVDSDAISTKDGSPDVALTFVNHGYVTFQNGYWYVGGLSLNLFNLGTVEWISTQYGAFFGTGSVVNSHILISNGTSVYLSDYLSQGGKLVSYNYGTFTFGPSAGLDTKTVVLCEKKKSAEAKTQLTHRRVEEKPVAVSNISCNPNNWDDCPVNLCCGAHGFCEAPRCENADGYGGGPMCCGNNTVCGGSSHGPYCGTGIFSWEVDTDCVEGLEYVDRYEFESMKQRFDMEFPKFGRHRYTFRGESTIEGDGTGAVVFGEPLEFRSTVHVASGGVLRSVMDSGMTTFAGHGRLRIANGGKFVSGIRTSLDSTTHVSVEAGGVLEVASFGTLRMTSDAHVVVARGATLQVDGRLLVTKGTSKVSAVKQCGTLAGVGAVVEEIPLALTGEGCAQ